MPTYVMLATWTDQGIRAHQRLPEARSKPPSAAPRDGRTEIKSVLMTMGALTADESLSLSLTRRDRAVVLGSLGIVVLLAWAWLLSGAGIDMRTMPIRDGWMPVMPPRWSLGHSALVLVMWCVMMVAMMLPSAAPVTLLAAAIARKRKDGRAGGDSIPFFVLGYLSVWFIFSVAATEVQWALDESSLLSGRGALTNAMLTGLVLVAAGIYQWTPIKAACLRHCRSPLEYLLFHWQEGPFGALSSGIEHGIFCLGCCWMLMALLFVGGIMSPAWIGAIALLVLVEKTLPWGARISYLVGGALAAWGVITLASTI
jgi:predicted metal-binding membrane protein